MAFLLGRGFFAKERARVHVNVHIHVHFNWRLKCIKVAVSAPSNIVAVTNFAVFTTVTKDMAARNVTFEWSIEAVRRDTEFMEITSLEDMHQRTCLPQFSPPSPS